VVLLAAGVAALAVAGALPTVWLNFAGSAGMAWSPLRAAGAAVRGLHRKYGAAVAWSCSVPLWILGGLLALRGLTPLWGDGRLSVRLDVPNPFNLGLMFAFVVLGLMLNAGLCSMVVLRLVRRLQHLSQHDALTGVLNRRGLEQALQQEHDRLRRHGRPYALLTVDVDHFKRINDERGHAAGDAVLVGLAATLREGCRALDRVGRTGGEEFALLLPEADLAAAQAAAARLLDAVRASVHGEAGDAPRITVSLGLVLADDPRESLNEVWRRADAALYAAKSGGRDRAVTAPGRGSAAAPA